MNRAWHAQSAEFHTTHPVLAQVWRQLARQANLARALRHLETSDRTTVPLPIGAHASTQMNEEQDLSIGRRRR